MEATQETDAAPSVHDLLMQRSAEPVTEEVTEEVSEEVDIKADITEEAEEVSVEETTEEQTHEVEAQPEGETIELDEIATYLGIDTEKLDVDDESGALLFKTKVDGEEGTVSLTQLIKERQLEGHLNKKNMEVAEKEKALQAKLDEQSNSYTEKLQQADDYLTIAATELTKEYQEINWAELRADDPAEYAAKITDYNARQASINQSYQDLQTQRQEQQATAQEGLSAVAAEEKAKLLTALPEWNNQETAAKDWGDMLVYGSDYGLSSAEMNGVVDHRIVLMMRKAMMFDNMQKETPSITKRVRKTPKLAKPSAAKSQETTSKVDELYSSIKKHGAKTGDIAALLLARNKGN